MLRLAVVSSHPIQYNAPAFRAIADEDGVNLRVFYEWHGSGTSVDREFGRRVEWDIPLLEGYDYTFVDNCSRDPGTHHFRGIESRTLIPQIREWRPDVILVYGWAFASHVRVLRRFHGHTPIMFRGDSTLTDNLPAPKRVARRALLGWVYAKIDIALYAGTRNREYYRWAGVPDHALRWAPHAVDNERFRGLDSHQKAASEWRVSLGIGREDTAFLFSGKLIPIKRPVHLLRTFRALKPIANSSVHLIFVGEGNLRSQLESESAGDGRIHFLGFQNQSVMPTVYHMADVLVLPSSKETWGLSVNEAMAASRPAIVSDRVGCSPDLIIPGITGLQFPFDEETGLGDALLEITTRAKALEMGLRAREHIEGWSIPDYAAAVVKAAREIRA